MSPKRTVTLLSFYYAILFMSAGSYGSYISLYYASIKMTNADIGSISTMAAFITLIAQPIWGTISDRSHSKNNVLKTAIALSAITTWLIPLAHNNFWLLLAASGIFSFFHTSVSPLSDTVALELSRSGKFKFARVRIMGSLGFAIMAAAAGVIFSSGIQLLFLIFFSLRAISFAISFFIPRVKGYKDEKEQKSFFELFKDKNLVITYIYVFLLSTTFGFFNVFHAIYSKESGVPLNIIGIGIMIGSLSQFPFMLFFDRVYKKFGPINIMIFSGLMYSLRWFLYATILTKYTILPLWFMHGLNFIILYFCLAEYVSATVPKELRTRGQMMNSITLSGISAIAGAFIGGHIATSMGLKFAFAACSVLCLTAVLGFFLVTRIWVRKRIRRFISILPFNMGEG